ncbi:unnamed protein product, partial [Aphanomyces euteiches]
MATVVWRSVLLWTAVFAVSARRPANEKTAADVTVPVTTPASLRSFQADAWKNYQVYGFAPNASKMAAALATQGQNAKTTSKAKKGKKKAKKTTKNGARPLKKKTATIQALKVKNAPKKSSKLKKKASNKSNAKPKQAKKATVSKKKSKAKKAQKGKTLKKDESGTATASFKCGMTATLTTCAIGNASELCILSDADGQCTPQFIYPVNKTGDKQLVTVQDLKEVLTISALPENFDAINFDDLDRGVVAQGLTVPTKTTVFKITKSRLQGYPDPKFNGLKLPPSIERLDFSDNEMTTFNCTEWSLSPNNLIEMALNNNNLNNLDNVVIPSKLQKLFLANNIINSFNGTSFPPTLSYLDMRMNKVGAFAKLPFGDSSVLDTLILGENNFTTLVASDVATLPKSLRTLDLQHNKIVTIDAGTVWPENLESLDLSQNMIESIATLQLPKNLKKLFLNDNPVKNFTMSAAQFALLSNIDSVTMPPLTGACPRGYRSQSTSQSTNVVTVCVTYNGDGISSKLPLILGIVGGGVCIAAFAIYAYRRHHDREQCKLADEYAMLALEGNRQIGSGYRSNPAALARGIILGRRTTGSSAASSSGSGENESAASGKDRSTLSDYPVVLSEHPELVSVAIPCGAISDLSPFVGDTSVGVYNDHRVLLKPLFTDREVETIEMYATLEHPKVVHFVGVTWDLSGTLSIVSEFLPRGSLHAFLDGRRSSVPTFDVRLSLAVDVAEALTYFHFLRRPFVHLNLTYDTVLVAETEEGDVFAKVQLPVEVGAVSADKIWVAPEILRGDEPTPAADVYSLGVLLSALDGAGLTPLLEDTGDATCTGDHRYSLMFGDERLGELGSRCLAQNQAFRPSAMDVVYGLRNLVHEGTKSWLTGLEISYEDLDNAISGAHTNKECRYGEFELDCTTTDSKDALRQGLIGAGIFLNATDQSELELASIQDGVSRFSSGVGVHDDVVTKFNGFKLQSEGHRHRFVTFKIVGDEVTLDQLGDRDNTYEDFVNAISGPHTNNECRYGVFDLDCTTKDGRPTSKLVFISWSPDTTTIKNKMLYSSSKEALKRVLVGVGIFLNATDQSELEFASIQD